MHIIFTSPGHVLLELTEELTLKVSLLPCSFSDQSLFVFSQVPCLRIAYLTNSVTGKDEKSKQQGVKTMSLESLVLSGCLHQPLTSGLGIYAERL